MDDSTSHNRGGVRMMKQDNETSTWADPPTVNDLLEAAWGIIANSYGGDWDQANSEWRGAAERWRDNYFANANPDQRSTVEVTQAAADG